MGIVRDLYYARKMGAGLKLPAPSVALLIKRLALSKILSPAVLKTVTGALLHITDALAKPAEELLVDLSPIQDLHGYSSPWPAGGGVNRLNPATVPEQGGYIRSNNGLVTSNTSWRYSDYIPVTPGEVLYFGEIYANASTAGTAYYDSNKVYVSGFSATSLGDSNGVMTVPEGVAFMRHSWLIQEGYNENWETTVYIIPNSSPHEFTPYSNICPITGRTGVTVYVGPTQDQQDATTYSVDWTSPAGTVYGGTLDVVTGVLTVDRAQISSYAGETLPGAWISDRDAYAAGTTPTTGAQVVYELATPLTYQLTAQEVELLLGENYLWESSGADLSLTYYADGNANTLDALNLMLGNRYVNNHTPDDVSDREALDILLGR